MLIIFPDGNEAATAQKTALISAYLAGDADIVLCGPDADEYGGLDDVDPANIRFRFAMGVDDENDDWSTVIPCFKTVFLSI
jgi:hypothetical protein